MTESISREAFLIITAKTKMSDTEASRVRKYIHAGSDKPERQKRYGMYLQSTNWKLKRDLVVKLAQGKCEVCKNEAEHVHHWTYSRLGVELLEDLVAVCEPCHTKIHAGEFCQKALKKQIRAERIWNEEKTPSGIDWSKKVHTRKPDKKNRLAQSKKDKTRHIENLKQLKKRPKGMNKKEWYALHPELKVAPVMTRKRYMSGWSPTSPTTQPVNYK